MSLQRIQINPSPTLLFALCAAHVAAAAAIGFAALPLWLKCILMAAIAAGLVWSLYSRALLRPGWAIVALEISVAGQISFLTRRGSWHACVLLGTTYVSPHVTILNLRGEDRRLSRHVVLVPDNVDPGDFRRLRVWLRWAARAHSRGTLTPGNDMPII